MLVSFLKRGSNNASYFNKETKAVDLLNSIISQFGAVGWKESQNSSKIASQRPGEYGNIDPYTNYLSEK